MVFPKSYLRRGTLWTLSVMLGLLGLNLLGWRAAAKAKTAPSARGQNSLAGVLNADGSLKADAQGSFDASGYRMEYMASGAPRFVAATACSPWDTQFFSLADGVNANVYAIVISGNDIYVGGGFTLTSNIGANRVAKYNTLTNTWSALGTGCGNGVNNIVNALALIGDDLYVGGFSRWPTWGAQLSV